MIAARRRLLAALLALLAVGGAACGIPTDGEPRLLAEEPQTTPDAAAPSAGDATATVFLVGSSNQLVARSRGLEGPETPEAVLGALLLRLNEAETAAGLTTNIPLGTTALSVEVEDGTAVVDMSEAWRELAEPGATTAYAQVVLTLTELPSVSRVRFRIEGEPAAAPTVNQGTLDVVSAEDYRNLDPSG